MSLITTPKAPEGLVLQPQFRRYHRTPGNETGAPGFIDGLIDLYADAGGPDPNLIGVEIGVWTGESAEIAAQMVGHLHCVDPWEADDDHEEVFDARMAKFTNITKHKMGSIEAARQFADQSMHLVYIDGRHEYQHVKADIFAWFPKVMDGYWVAGHDYDKKLASHAGVVQAVDEVLGTPLLRYSDNSWMFRKTPELTARVAAIAEKEGAVQPFLVVAAGRSGTQYMTRVLQAMDVAVKHEYVFRPGKLAGQTLATMTTLCREEGVQGDVSWFAVPFLHLVPPSWPIIHLVRNPVKVIRSWAAHGFWPLGRESAPVRTVAETLDWPEGMLKDELECSIQYWLGWNRLISEFCEKRRQAGQRALVVRLEDFTASSVVVRKVLDHIGHEAPTDVGARQKRIPRDIGATKYMRPEGVYRYSKPLDPSIRWDGFSPETKAAILRVAEPFGYTLHQLQGA